MSELKLKAVGSSPLIAEEIKSVVQSFLGKEIFIDTATTKEVKQTEADTFYICAKSQEEFLRTKIPTENFFVFDLHPTTKFFLDIAQIPVGSEVYVFNNLLPYTKLLAEECRALGVDKVNFHSIAYDEMPADEVCAALGKARYIIGVDCLVGEQMLFSDVYRGYLRSDVKIIAGKRVASIPSASKLLARVAGFYYESLLEEKNTLDNSRPEQIELLLDKVCQTIKILRRAVNHVVTGQVVINGNSNSTEKFIVSSKSKIDLKLLNEQLQVLFYIKQKIIRLHVDG